MVMTTNYVIIGIGLHFLFCFQPMLKILLTNKSDNTIKTCSDVCMCVCVCLRACMKVCMYVRKA